MPFLNRTLKELEELECGCERRRKDFIRKNKEQTLNMDEEEEELDDIQIGGCSSTHIYDDE